MFQKYNFCFIKMACADREDAEQARHSSFLILVFLDCLKKDSSWATH